MKTLLKGFMAAAFLMIVAPAFAIQPAPHAGQMVGDILPQTKDFLGVLQEGGKSQLVAALLALFLGGWGVHRYYLGYKKEGKKMLMITLIGIGLYIVGSILTVAVPILGLIFILLGSIALFYTWILSIIDFIKILTGDLKPVDGDYTETI